MYSIFGWFPFKAKDNKPWPPNQFKYLHFSFGRKCRHNASTNRRYKNKLKYKRRKKNKLSKINRRKNR